jgi:exosortase family protein XrtF
MSGETSIQYKGVVRFLVTFIGLYLILNVVYGFFIEYYHPGVDPLTEIVSSQVTALLSVFDYNVSMNVIADSPFIPIVKNNKLVIRAFEGCNGINVMIVFLCFLFAFSGSLKRTIYYLLFGLFVIHAMNLLRVSLLYEVALHRPSQLYFFHKYLFTGILYLVVFVLWYFWVKQIKEIESGTSAD